MGGPSGGRHGRAAAGMVLAVFLLGGGAGAQAAGNPVPPTWEQAYVALPVSPRHLVMGRMSENLIRETLISLPAGKKFLTVLYLHGCSGFSAGNFEYLHLLAGYGYAVIAPDSFARPGRPKTCDPKLHAGIPGAPHQAVAEMRLEEIRYTLKRIRELRWVDQRNLFLMGHSQGGGAAAAYAGGGFRGRILSGSLCMDGPNSPEGTPVLSIYSEEDPWRHGRDARGCEKQAKARRLPVEFHLFPGNVHNLVRNPEARALIRSFLERHAALSH